ncbi:hypothetical protein D3C76_1810390 [compost metagenome]
MDSAVRRMSSVFSWLFSAALISGYCSRRSRFIETLMPVWFQSLLYKYLLESYS